MENRSSEPDLVELGVAQTNASSSPPDEQDPDTKLYTAVAAAIWVYGSPAIFVLGIVGNTLSLLVMCRRKFRHSTTAIYLSVLAITDTAILIFDMGNDWLKYTFGIHLRYVSGRFCTVTVFGLFFLATFQSWLLVNITIERLIAVLLPLRARFLFTRRRVCLGLVATAVSCFALHAHLLWYLRLYEFQPGRTACIFLPVISRAVLQAYNLLDMIISTFLPFVVMFILNGWICRLLFRSEMKWSSAKSHGREGRPSSTGSLTQSTEVVSRSSATTVSADSREPTNSTRDAEPKTSTSSKPPNSTSDAEPVTSTSKTKISSGTRSTTITLLLVTYTFLLLKAPRSGLLFYQSINPIDFDDTERRALIHMIWSLCDLLLALNSAINIILYCSTGRKFRQELIEMLSFRRSTEKPVVRDVDNSSSGL